eukprot:jgi/Bigna1/88202/estExt_fgenesh1_pg.C_290059
MSSINEENDGKNPLAMNPVIQTDGKGGRGLSINSGGPITSARVVSTNLISLDEVSTKKTVSAATISSNNLALPLLPEEKKHDLDEKMIQEQSMSLPTYMRIELSENELNLKDLKPPYDRCDIAAVLINDGIHGRDLYHLLDLQPLKMYKITHNRSWRRTIVAVSIVNLCLAFFESPCMDALCAPVPLLLTIEAICLMVYSVDTILELYARGSTHFFASGWNKAKIPILLFSWIWVFLPHELRIQRMLRPFFALAYAHNLRKVMNSMFQGMVAITYIGTLVVFHLVIFAIVGTKFYAEISPKEFGTFYRSCISLFTLLTTVVGLFIFLNLVLATVFNSYKERLEHDLEVYRNRAKLAFQAAFQLCDVKGTGAIDKAHFLEVLKHLRPDFTAKERESCFLIADVDKTNKIEHEDFGIIVVLYNLHFEKEEAMRRSEAINSTEGVFTRTAKLRWQQFRDKIREVLAVKIPHTNLLAVETFIDISVVINLFLLIATDYIDRQDADNIYTFLSVILVIHSTEMAAVLIASHERVFNEYFNILDLTVLLVAILEWIIKGQGGDLAALRSIRLLRLLRYNQGFEILYQAIVRSAPVLTALFCVLLQFMYFFAVVGMDLLEGKLTRENVPENLAYHTNDYFGLNYDSLVNGLIVQFNLLVVNNWFIVADAACSVSNEGMRAFFILFYILGVLVALNVITAFILDTVMFVRAFPDREEEYKQLIKQVESISKDACKLEGYDVELHLHHSMDLVLGEMFQESTGDNLEKVAKQSEQTEPKNVAKPRSVGAFDEFVPRKSSISDSSKRTALLKLARIHRGSIA